MANYTTSANVVISVNGSQAQKMMSQLEKDAKRLEKGIAQAASAGDKATAKKLQRELNATNKTMEQLKGTANSVENTLRRLDSATPKELNKTLSQLKQQLNGIQRGTAAWDAHVAKIQRVKAELQRVNATMAAQQSTWKNFKGWINNASTAVMGAAAALTGLVVAGRKAVNSYADMQETMTNTQKYTRMTAAEVEELNEIFKGMDTRLAREQLNLLAQEGGRLGYNTVDKVREYVEAASIINVALVDLGEGATQTIAKLSNIFGIEEMYGTRDAMLKIGSTVNHLSQNCTAAKPFIVEFAQRMAGIGSTANMSIPEIMAFAATLDANGQKVEMSATALQRTIMELYKKPAEMARKVGLDTNEFIKTLNTSTTQGVMIFLDALNKLGEDKALAVLSPLFQDLGLDGARVSSVLTNLSSHLDFLKWQMGEAAEAFREGTSASNEFALFNNTVQASIDKAKKKISELSVQLGEKLYPIMKHIYSSSSLLMRALNVIVDFLSKHGKVLGVTIGLLAAYYSWVGLTKVAVYAKAMGLKLLTATQQAYNVCVKTFNVLAGGAKLVMAGMTNAALYFKNGLEVTQGAQLRWNTAIKSTTASLRALGTAIKATPIGVLVGLAVAAFAAISNLGKAQESIIDQNRKLMNSATELDGKTLEELDNIKKLFNALEQAKEGTAEYERAKNKLLGNYGKYLKGLVDEEGKILNLTEAYDSLTAAVKRANQERNIKETQEKINNSYYEGIANDLKNMRTQLNYWSDDTAMIERTMTELTEYANSGKFVSQEVVNFLNGLGNMALPEGASWWARSNQKFTNWMNSVPALELLIDDSWDTSKNGKPADYINSITAQRQAIDETNRIAETQLSNLNKFYNADTDLEGVSVFIKHQIEAVENGDLNALGSIPSWDGNNFVYLGNSTLDEAKRLVKEIDDELYYRKTRENDAADPNEGDIVIDPGDYTPYVTEEERKAEEAKKRREEIKARKEFKEDLDKEKGIWENLDAYNTSEYSNGNKTWKDYLLKRHEIEMDYFDGRKAVYEKWNLQEDEDYQELLKKKEEATLKWNDKYANLSVSDIDNRLKKDELQAQLDYVTVGNDTYQKEDELNSRLYKLRLKALEDKRDLYKKGQEEYENYSEQIEQAKANEQLRIQQNLTKKLEEFKNSYGKLGAERRKKVELEVLEKLYQKKMIVEKDYLEWKARINKKYEKEISNKDNIVIKRTDGSTDSFDTRGAIVRGRENAENLKADRERRLAEAKRLYDEGVTTEEQYQQQCAEIRKKYNSDLSDILANMVDDQTAGIIKMADAWINMFSEISEKGSVSFETIGDIAKNSCAMMCASLQMVSEFMSAQQSIDLANVEERYEKQMELTEGNSYKERKLQKQKEEEVAKIKAEYAEKEFAIKVAMAIGQTAQNAIMGWAAGLQTPFPMFLWMPELLAGLATAQGLVQVALLKKQQQAAMAQGYAEGGFTRPGGKFEEVGVVHAGEWVASQKLVNNPKTRPLIDALEYAQRTNTIGSITHADVSRSITAPLLMASSSAAAVPASVPSTQTVVVQQNEEYVNTLRRLSDRLNEPFVTVNTVTGDLGIQKAQDDYARLLKNKAPKYKR